MVEAMEGRRPSTENETEKDSQIVKSLDDIRQALGHVDAFLLLPLPFELLFVAQGPQCHLIGGRALFKHSMLPSLGKDRGDTHSVLIDDSYGAFPSGRHVDGLQSNQW